MQYEVLNNGIKTVYRLYEGASCHPESIDSLEDEAIDDLIEALDEQKLELSAAAIDPDLLLAQGEILYIGYDAEWVEINGRNGRVLKVLSYQFYLVGVAGEMSAVFFPTSTGVGGRLDLQTILAELLSEAYKSGIILDYPADIVLVGFFLRADLAMLADLIEFKTELSNVGGSIATTAKPVEMFLVCNRRAFDRLESDRRIVCGQERIARQVEVSFYDIAKHAPEKTPLSALGDLLQLPKLAIPEGYSVAQMDELLAGNLEAFLAYGIRDAEIAIKYYLHVLKFANELLGGRRIAKGFLPVSAGAMAVKLCLKKMKESGLEYEDIFGVASVTRQVWDDSTRRVRTISRTEHDGMRQFHEEFASRCYHGGRNESYYFGPSVPSLWFDLDLSGAYSTGMAVIRPIDYGASYETREVEDFIGDVMGFAWVDFDFPADKTRFPCLPVRTDLGSLQFPLRGTSHCTAPELALALQMGGKVKIRRGVIYPWVDGDQRVFLPFVQEIKRLRKSYPKDSLPEQYAKLLGNSLYGKTGQGLKEKTAFDTGTMQSRKVPESSVSNAPMAAHVTGFIRAVMGEILHGIPAHRTVISCTTDGILTDASEDELDLSGALCQRFQNLINRA
jgi:hypothetical protein